LKITWIATAGNYLKSWLRYKWKIRAGPNDVIIIYPWKLWFDGKPSLCEKPNNSCDTCGVLSLWKTIPVNWLLDVAPRVTILPWLYPVAINGWKDIAIALGINIIIVLLSLAQMHLAVSDSCIEGRYLVIFLSRRDYRCLKDPCVARWLILDRFTNDISRYISWLTLMTRDYTTYRRQFSLYYTYNILDSRNSRDNL